MGIADELEQDLDDDFEQEHEVMPAEARAALGAPSFSPLLERRVGELKAWEANEIAKAKAAHVIRKPAPPRVAPMFSGPNGSIELCPFEGLIGQGLEVGYSRDGRYAFAKVDASLFERVIGCGVCQGYRGYIPTLREDGNVYVVPCAAGRAKEAAELFNQARIPATYAHTRLDNPELDDPIVRRLYADATRLALELTPGDLGRWWSGTTTGVGKTRIMCAVLRVLTLERRIECRFVRFAELLGALKATFNRGPREGERAEDILEPIARIPVLAIDDFGSSHTLFELATFEELIKSRADRVGTTTLITSNYTPEAIRRGAAKHSGGSDPVGALGRSISRLRGMVEIKTLVGRDRRGEGAG